MRAVHEGAPNYALLLSRYCGSSQWERALEIAREWLASDPEEPPAHRGAAHALVQLKRYPEARPHLEKVLAKNPQDDFAHRLLSIVAFHTPDLKLADQEIHRAIEINPREAYHWYHLAHMSYHQRDFASAKEAALKARELAPGDADISNLLAMSDPGAKGAQLQQYLEALALEPENPNIHNNIGVYRLNVERDYKAAEECFRRALFFSPTSPLYRKNLFLTLKHRDPVYRYLCAPKDFLFRIWGFGQIRKGRVLVPVLLIPVWLVCFRFVLLGLALWFLLVWPLVKVYEYLTLGDLKTRAGEIGAKRGGLLGCRTWPLNVRLGIFAALLMAFWGGVYLCSRTPTGSEILTLLAAFGVISLLVVMLVRAARKSRIKSHSRRRARKFDDLFNTPPAP